jgi:hypothetical protein
MLGSKDWLDKSRRSDKRATKVDIPTFFFELGSSKAVRVGIVT